MRYLLKGATEGAPHGGAALGDGVVGDASHVERRAALDLSEGSLQGATERPALSPQGRSLIKEQQALPPHSDPKLYLQCVSKQLRDVHCLQ